MRWNDGSIRPTFAATADRLSPLNPPDAPDAGNVWKPSNRDAGNLSAQRWTAYYTARRAARDQAAERDH